MQKTELQEQDIELAQHTHHYDGNTEVEGDNDEVRRLKIYLMHLLVIIKCTVRSPLWIFLVIMMRKSYNYSPAL